LPSEATLAFDTSGPWCSVALVSGNQVLAHRHEAMERGQGERLFEVIAKTMKDAGAGWADLAAIGVGTGPGNFTGIRIGVSAARGLSLGLGIPAIGVDRFEAGALDGPDLPVLVPAPHGMAWAARPGEAPAQIASDVFSGRVISDPTEFPSRAATAPAYPLAIAIARLADARRRTTQPRPAPLYLRPADAAPSPQGAPALLD